jgi:hypothetical protein
MNPLEQILNVGGKILDKLFPDANQAAEMKLKLAALAQQGALDEFNAMAATDKEQIEVNKIEAANPSLFVSGWRPAVGWVCVVALASYYIPRFTLGMMFWCKLAWDAQGVLPPMPEMGVADILGLVATLLGSSAIRMREKQLNVARAA